MENREALREKERPSEGEHGAVGDIWFEEGRGGRLYWSLAAAAAAPVDSVNTNIGHHHHRAPLPPHTTT
jgi:hypothetical protein